MKSLLVIVVAIFFVVSCANDEERNAAEGKGDQLTEAENVARDGGDYLARIGDAVITQQDMDNELAVMPGDRLRFYAGEGGRDRLLREMVTREMLYLEAIEKGMDKKPEYLMKIEHLKKVALVEMLLKTKSSGEVKITDEDVIAYYNEHKATRFTDRATGEVIELQEIKEMVRKQLIVDKQREVFDRYIAELTEKFKAEAENVAADGGDYLARIGDAVITQQDMDNELAVMPRVIPKDRLRLYAGEGGRDRLLREMVTREMLYLEAIEKGMDKKPEYLMKIEYLKKMALVEMYLGAIFSGEVKITDEDVIAYYNEHKATRFTDRATGEVIELQEIKEMVRKQLIVDKQREVFDRYIAELTEKYRPVIKAVK